MKSNGIATTKKSAIASMAICAVFTMLIQVPILPAMGGIVHFGNVPLFIAAAFLGKRTGATAPHGDVRRALIFCRERY